MSKESYKYGEDDLDFGYMEEFNRNKEFMLIQKGVVRRKKELQEELREWPESRSLPKLRNQHSERPIRKEREAYFNLSKRDESVQKLLSSSVYSDPYSMEEREGRGKVRKLHQKLRRIGVVNSRIQKAYEKLVGKRV